MGLDIRPTRIRAIDGSGITSNSRLTAKEVACLKSHQLAIESIPDQELGLILEDDVLFAPNFGAKFTDLTEYLSKMSFMDAWDIVFLGHTPNYKDLNSLNFWLRSMRKLERRESNNSFSLVGGERYIWGAFAYLINPRSKAFISREIQRNLQSDAPYPVDDLMRHLNRLGQLKSLILFPSLVGVDPNFSTTINDRRLPNDSRLHVAAANSLVHGLDPELLRAQFQDESKSFPSPKEPLIDHRAELLTDIAREYLYRD
jgi:GR25 family glycosyltransferase involved in LPS biosynthesis